MVVVTRFLKGFLFAFSGVLAALKSERNLRVHLAATCLAVAIGLYLGLSPVEWSLVVFAVGLVWVAELFNTAIERLGDEAAHGKHTQLVRYAKDISAGAVLMSALTALVIGFLLLLVPFVRRMFELR